MSIRTILVPVDTGDAMRSTLQTAVLLGRRFDGYIEGLAIRPPVMSVLSLDIPNMVELETAEYFDAQSRRNSRDLFQDFMQGQRVPRREQGSGGLSFGWRDTAPDGYTFLGRYGRDFDITIVSRPCGGDSVPQKYIVEQCLFKSGRPILLSPPSAPGQVGENILIAWNGSRAQARATALAMPLLERAGRVAVLTCESDAACVRSGEKLARNLERHGIAVDAVSVPRDRQNCGDAILAYAKAAGFDLLVKGADARSWMSFLGGPTRQILEQATIPVFMAY
jgi:nucleotide-binding universal stress UspA family protein